MSPTTKARLAGVFFLATIVGGIIAQVFIGDRLIVTGDAAATARNIVANPNLIRVAYAIFITVASGSVVLARAWSFSPGFFLA